MDEAVPATATTVNGGGRLFNFRATELRLGPPGSNSPERVDGDRPEGHRLGDLFFSRSNEGDDDGGGPVQRSVRPMKLVVDEENSNGVSPTSSKTQVVGWPPIRSFRKNTMASHPTRSDNDIKIKAGSGRLFVKVSMDGAPYLRKVHLTAYASYSELSVALENMFSCFTICHCSSHEVSGQGEQSESRKMALFNGSEYVLTYEDKDGDWMLVGDVPWKMFTETCRRLRIMKSSEAIRLAPRATEKELQL